MCQFMHYFLLHRVYFFFLSLWLGSPYLWFSFVGSLVKPKSMNRPTADTRRKSTRVLVGASTSSSRAASLPPEPRALINSKFDRIKFLYISAAEAFDNRMGKGFIYNSGLMPTVSHYWPFSVGAFRRAANARKYIMGSRVVREHQHGCPRYRSFLGTWPYHPL